jgi:excisionase family DNA binding protein
MDDKVILDIRARLGHWSRKGKEWRIAPAIPGGETVNMSARTPEAEPLLTPAEVATMFRVDPKTVTRWAKAGKLTSIRTLGGHRRYRETEVRALLAGIPQQRSE